MWDFQNYLSELDAANATKVLYVQTPDTYGQLIGQRTGASVFDYFFFDGLRTKGTRPALAASPGGHQIQPNWGLAS